MKSMDVLILKTYKTYWMWVINTVHCSKHISSFSKLLSSTEFWAKLISLKSFWVGIQSSGFPLILLFILTWGFTHNCHYELLEAWRWPEDYLNFKIITGAYQTMGSFQLRKQRLTIKTIYMKQFGKTRKTCPLCNFYQ